MEVYQSLYSCWKSRFERSVLSGDKNEETRHKIPSTWTYALLLECVCINASNLQHIINLLKCHNFAHSLPTFLPHILQPHYKRGKLCNIDMPTRRWSTTWTFVVNMCWFVCTRWVDFRDCVSFWLLFSACLTPSCVTVAEYFHFLRCGFAKFIYCRMVANSREVDGRGKKMLSGSEAERKNNLNSLLRLQRRWSLVRTFPVVKIS